jgi:hypothetical protein
MTPRLYIISHHRIMLSFPIQLFRALQERYEAMSNSAHSLKKKKHHYKSYTASNPKYIFKCHFIMIAMARNYLIDY